MMISGNNFQNGASRTSDSFRQLTIYRICRRWGGWATWRRFGWRHFVSIRQVNWPQARLWGIKASQKNLLSRPFAAAILRHVVAAKSPLGIPMDVLRVGAERLSIVPDVNLVTLSDLAGGDAHMLFPTSAYVCAKPCRWNSRCATPRRLKPCHEAAC